MKKKKTNTFAPLILLMVIAVLGYYTYLSSHSKTQQEKAPVKTDKENLLDYNLEEDYPRTVRETVKLYCKYTKLAYSGKCSDEDLYKINLKMRELLDDELLELNSTDKQLQGLKFDIALYEEKKQKFVSYTLEEASMIQYNTENDKEYAKTKVTFNITVGMSAATVDQEYLLRKDDQGRWKILGWNNIPVKKNKGDEE